MKLASIHLVFVPEGEFEPSVDSDLGIDGTEVVPNHRCGSTEVLGDFVILQSLGHHFDDPELTRARLLKGKLCWLADAEARFADSSVRSDQTASDGEEALVMACVRLPDLILRGCGASQSICLACWFLPVRSN